MILVCNPFFVELCYTITDYGTKDGSLLLQNITMNLNFARLTLYETR